MKFEREYLIGIEDIGKNNQITNLGYLKYLEEIACSHSATCGYGANDIETKKRAWLLMDWKLRVLDRPIYEKKLQIKTWARNISKNYFFSYRDFEVYCEDKLVAIATSKWVLYDFNTKRITKLTDEIYEPYNSETVHVFESEDIEKIAEPNEKTFSMLYDVRRSDIDINKHMHNLNYLKLAYENLPENIFFGDELKNVNIMYKHQILLGQKVKCYYSKANEKHIITIKSEDDKVLHSIIEIS